MSQGIFSYFSSRLNRNKLGELLVQNGLLSKQDLKKALKLQKAERAPLGTILIEHKFISARSLRHTLFEQAAFRAMAMLITMIMSFSALGVKKTKAAQMKDIPPSLSLMHGANMIEPLNYYPALFGSDEKQSYNLRPFTKWSGMFERLDSTISKPSSQAVIAKWQQELSGYQGLSLYAMAKKINDYVNSYEYINDDKLWGKSDYWATPIEFFTRGGDCEDFAIAKYASLRALGVPEERLRLAIVHDKQKNIPHAVLIVYTERGAMVLDNQNKTMKASHAVDRYRPIFSINREAWWLHTKPSADTLRVASVR